MTLSWCKIGFRVSALTEGVTTKLRFSISLDVLPSICKGSKKKSKLLCYDFSCREVEKDDFVLLASSHFSFVSSDINAVVHVNLRL